MSRRSSQDEPDFGSDSFLDIIANLVGILIILIVLAGLRASETVELAREQHLRDEETGKTAEDDRESMASQTTVVPVPDITPRASAAQRARAEEQRARAEEQRARAEEQRARAEERQRRMAAIEESSRLTILSSQMQQRVVQLRTETGQFDNTAHETALAESKRKQQHADAALKVLQATRSRINTEQSQAASLIQEQSIEVQQLDSQQVAASQELTKLVEAEPTRKPLTHQVSPVGQIVTGEEIHFRISRGKISHVPVGELTGILKEQIQQNGSWLLKYNQHEGVIGPVDGYRLKYVVARERLSVVDELRSGPGAVRIGVSELVILPDSGLQEERVPASLQRGGLVDRRLNALSPGSPVTLWVYPDSFAEYRQVTAFARRNGFIVAGRPLPTGMPITGSTHGSKSVAQ